MQDTESPTRARKSSVFPVALLVIVAIACGAAVTWFLTAYKPQQEAQAAAAARLMIMTGVGRHVHNVLDAAYTDADSDLVADAPTDAGKLVDPAKITFCYIATEDENDYAAKWKPFCEYLSKVTGKPVEYMDFRSTEDQLKAIHEGKLTVTGLNSGSVPMAVNLCGYVPIARVPTNQTGGTHVEIIVPAESPLQQITDLKDARYTLTLTEPNSNSGYKAPMVLLHSQGIDPEREYLIRTSGGHFKSIQGICEHKYDAAAVSADLLDRELSQGKVKKSQYRTIYTSESFPSAALGFVYNLKPELASKVREAILTFDMKDTPLQDEFAPTNQTKFIEVNYKNDWSLIRRIDDDCGQTYQLK